MSTTSTGTATVGDTLAEFLSASTSERDAAYQRLVALLWDGTPTPLALAAVPDLIASLADVPADAAALLAVIPGLPCARA